MKHHLENPVWGRSTYVSPSLEIIELTIEGSVCVFDSKNSTEGIGRDPYEDL